MMKKLTAVTLAKKGLEQQEPVPEEIERLELLVGCLGTQSHKQSRTGKSGIIDFESIIQEYFGDDLELSLVRLKVQQLK